MNIAEHMKSLAKEDIDEILDILQDKGINAELISFEVEPEDIPESIEQTVRANIKVGQDTKEIQFKYLLDYKNGPDEITIDKDCTDIADEFYDNINSAIKTKKSKIISSTITAADEDADFESDEFDETPADGMIVDDEFGEDQLSDTLDNISDKVDDIQDSMDDVQEDDVCIDIDNNISNHYVAECEKCKGIFISSVVETDQKLDKIHGSCPLCDKETDQYLKWIIKDIEV